ncbi:hypothetical protein ONZ45_g12752 [Pleurotus djamor]|nr:hypothetical protein ONZ45_g12752 [Pleurotus djamor]
MPIIAGEMEMTYLMTASRMSNLYALMNDKELRDVASNLVDAFTKHINIDGRGTRIIDALTLQPLRSAEGEGEGKQTAIHLATDVATALRNRLNREAGSELYTSAYHQRENDDQLGFIKTANRCTKVVVRGVLFQPVLASQGNSHIIFRKQEGISDIAGQIQEILLHRRRQKGAEALITETFLVVRTFAELMPPHATLDPYRRYPMAGKLYYSDLEDAIHIVRPKEIICHFAKTSSLDFGIPGADCIHVLPLNRIRHFLDIEADAVTSEEDEDSEGDNEAQAEKEFIVPPNEDPAHEDRRQESFRPPGRLDHFEQDREDALSEAQDILSRYRQTQETVSVEKPSSPWEDPIRFMPSIKDPDLWRVRVQKGLEMQVISTILLRSLNRNIPIATAFLKAEIPGFIYIEGSYADCMAAVRGVDGVRLRFDSSTQIELVNLSDRIAVLNQSSLDIRQLRSSFVRIQDRSIYRYDLAYVLSVSPNSFAKVLVVPRNAVICPLSGRKRRSPGKPCLARSPWSDDLEKVFPLPPLNDGKRYLEGLEIRRIHCRHLRPAAIPTVEELTLFEISPLYDPESSEVTEFTAAILRQREWRVPLEAGEDVMVISGAFRGVKGRIREVFPTTTRITTSNLDEMGSFEALVTDTQASVPISVGAHVEVTSGPYHGACGRVLDIHDTLVVIQPSSAGIDYRPTEIEIPTTELMRSFDVGDFIQIYDGEHRGLTGFVVELNANMVSIFLHESNSDVATPQPVLVSATTFSIKKCTRLQLANRPANLQTQPSIESAHSPDVFRGLEVLFVKHNLFKGRFGYIVGHSYVAGSSSRERLIFQVNPGISISTYTIEATPEQLEEK